MKKKLIKVTKMRGVNARSEFWQLEDHIVRITGPYNHDLVTVMLCVFDGNRWDTFDTLTADMMEWDGNNADERLKSWHEVEEMLAGQLFERFAAVQVAYKELNG